jgi:hypothetical protein
MTPVSGSVPVASDRFLLASSYPRLLPRFSSPGELAQRVRDLVLALVAAVQIDHRGALTVMAHTVDQLPKSRASARGQGVAGMSEVMEMEITKPPPRRAPSATRAVESWCDAAACPPGW